MDIVCNKNEVSGYRVVDQKHVLWTCHKACKIEYFDCCFCMCSVCYTKQTMDIDSSKSVVSKKKSKRCRTSRNMDDDNTLCKHDVDQLVPFMDQNFFSPKYKDTIAQERYKLPIMCSICKYELVDKIRNIDTSSIYTSTVGIVEI